MKVKFDGRVSVTVGRTLYVVPMAYNLVTRILESLRGGVRCARPSHSGEVTPADRYLSTPPSLLTLISFRSSMSYPEVIYDRATGVAADTVAKHAEPQPLVFYAGWVRTSHTSKDARDLIHTIFLQFCPYVQRNWIALEEKGVPYQYKEVNPYKKEPHFLGTFPHLC